MELRDIQNSLIEDAKLLGDYQAMSKTELANGYCDAEEAAWLAEEKGDEAEHYKQEMFRSAYHSALMLRYWYKIFEWMENSKSLRLDAIDFVEWLQDGLWVTFYYKTWRYEYEAVVKHGKFIEWKLDANGEKIPNRYYWKVDPNAPDRMIHRCCQSIRGKYYQYHNKDKRKANVLTYSLDAMVDEEGDYAVQWAGCTVAPESENGVYDLVNELLFRKEFLEALIIDGIANYDTYKEVKQTVTEHNIDDETGEEYEESYETSSQSLDRRKLVKHLNSIDENFLIQFCQNYRVEGSITDEVFKKMSKMTNTKLYKYIEKTLTEIKQTPSLLSCIANVPDEN